jgi:sec-independent protein translocase protein TatA
MPGMFSGWHWLVLLIVVILVFGTKKLKNVGQDLGDAVKGFRSAMAAGEKGEEPAEAPRIGEGAAQRPVEPPPAKSAAGVVPPAGDHRADYPNS